MELLVEQALVLLPAPLVLLVPSLLLVPLVLALVPLGLLPLALVPLQPCLEPELLPLPPRKTPEFMQHERKYRSVFIPWNNIYWHRIGLIIDAEDMRHPVLLI